MRAIPNAVAEQVARRDLAIDAMRGAAMLFVVLSHFGFVLVEPWPGVPVAVGDGLTVIGMVASPACMLVSGVTMAMLAEDAARFERLRWKLLDRGLFTLVVGHVLLGLADGSLLSSSPLRQNLVITDVVGLATIAAALTRVPGSPSELFRWAGVLFAASWTLFAFSEPDGIMGRSPARAARRWRDADSRCCPGSPSIAPVSASASFVARGRRRVCLSSPGGSPPSPSHSG